MYDLSFIFKTKNLKLQNKFSSEIYHKTQKTKIKVKFLTILLKFFHKNHPSSLNQKSKTPYSHPYT